MDKNSAEHKPCTYCDNEALPDTYPPVCAEHVNVKQASDDSEPATLKELESRD
jgi:hypothetical protein